MKKIINNKVYDTDKASELGQDEYPDGRDFHYWMEALYQKRTGEYFIYGKGGPLSRYAVNTGAGWTGGERITPVTAATAREWVEEHLSAEDYERIFGLPDEDAEPVAMNIQLPAVLMAEVRAKAADQGVSLTAYVEAALKTAIGQ